MKSFHGSKKGANGKPKPNAGGVQNNGNRGKQKRKLKEVPKATNNGTKQTSGLDRLTQSSEIPISRIPGDPKAYLNSLLPRDKLKCLGYALYDCTTARLSDFTTPLGQFDLVVPAYMTDRWGLTVQAKKNGWNTSGPRTNGNTGEIRFVVYGSETIPLDEQVAAVESLVSRGERLVLVVRSEPQRIQAWFSTRGMSKDQIDALRKYASVLGAPRSIFIDCHPYALPCGRSHQSGCKHRIIHWSPSMM